MKRSLILMLIVVIGISIMAQQTTDKGTFIEYNNTYWQKIVKAIEQFEQKPQQPSKTFKMDFSGKQFPTDSSRYKTLWHQPPTSQGNTGTCWCFCTTSFFESEIYRLTGKKVKLSEMYTVYWETVEKARRFVQERGNSLFDEGSEADAVVRMWKKYGIVPANAYPAMKPGQKFHNHEPMFKEMKAFLNEVKTANSWNEKLVLETIRAIMDHYIGAPPQSFVVDGKKTTPHEYLAGLQLDLNAYINLISLTQHPYYQKTEYIVPDNWWHSKEHFNVPLDDFMRVMNNSLRNGFSICLGGDISEPGYHINVEVAVVPSFDIPAAYIDEHARQFRFSNQTTTDDHGIHCVGWLEKDGQYWYLVKDSGSGSRTGKHHGYFFYREDYIKLKMMNIMVHKGRCPETVEEIPGRTKIEVRIPI